MGDVPGRYAVDMIVAPFVPDASRRARLRLLPAFTMLLAFFAAALAWSAPGAGAEPPSRLAQQVSDSAGVLGGDLPQIENRLEELRETDQIQLWATFVDTLDGIPVREWTQQTRILSDLGASDALLVVAVQDSTFWFEFDDPGASPTEDQRTAQRIADTDIEPRLAAGDRAGPLIRAAQRPE